MEELLSLWQLASDAGVCLEDLRAIGGPGDWVVVYSSRLDGFGTPASDLDVYVVGDEGQPGRQQQRFPRQSLPDQAREKLDIEWWATEQVDLLVRQAAACRARLDDLKVLHRLQEGLPVGTRDGRSQHIDLVGLELSAPVKQSLDGLCRDELRSTQGFLTRQQQDAACLTAKRALTYAAMGWCAVHGRLVFKEKWLLFALRAMRPGLARRYWRYQTEAGLDEILRMLRLTHQLIGDGAIIE